MGWSRRYAPAFALLACLVGGTAQAGPPRQAAQQASPATEGLLNREQTASLLPATVFYHGQVAPVQARNSAGLRLPGGRLMLVTLVDTSGYASSVQETYQAYLLTEFPLRLGDQTLPAGAYGFGFLSGDRMVVMDLGGKELLRTATMRDAQLRRPTPLQMLTDPSSANRYRLYLGRSFVTLEAVAPSER